MESGINLTEWILNYITFFREREYEIPSDFPDLAFQAISASGVHSVADLEPVLRTLTVKNSAQDTSFFYDFDDFIHDRKEKGGAGDARRQLKKYEANQKNLASLKNQQGKLEKKIADLKEAMEKWNASAMEEKLVESLLKDRKKIDGALKKLFENIRDEKVRKAFIDVRTLNKIPEPQVHATAMELMRFCIGEENGIAMMKHLEKMWKTRMKVKDPEISEEMMRQKLEKNEEKYQHVQEQLHEIEAAENERMVQKWKSQIHREEFVPGGAVRTLSEDQPLLNKNFNNLSAYEKECIRQYIFENARDFRTRMARNIRTGKKRQIDISQTCKNACATNGIPLKICYKKPVPSKANMVLFLDISGSCKEASELMLLFIYCMHDVFPGGCRAYVFVNHLYDISEFLDAPDPETAIQNILKTIPTKGVYSNYYEPLRDFHLNHFSEINRDSLVFFIGDARNNKNLSGEEHLREICRKVKKAFWLNTDKKEKWNQGDSIIGKYHPYLRDVMEVRTAGELLGSMNLIRGK